jgi:hypothetical protein
MNAGIVKQALAHEDPLKTLLAPDLGLLVADGSVEALVLKQRSYPAPGFV